MFRQHSRSQDATLLPDSSQTTLVSTFANTDLANEDLQNEAVSGQPEAHPGQAQVPGDHPQETEKPQETEIDGMEYSPDETPASTNSGGCEGVKPKEHESLINPSEHISAEGAATGSETVEIARPPWLQRFGKTAIAILILGTAIILSAVSFTGFLWFANFHNRLWHTIMARDWLTESVTILAEVIKQAVNLQIGIGGAMLAALALERGEVSLGNAATMTMIRNGLGSGNLLTLSKKQFQRKTAPRWSSSAIPYLILLETMILAFIQVITIILTSDIGLQPIPGFSKSSETAFGFTYRGYNGSDPTDASQIISKQTTWTRKATVYPTFAEYSEPPFIEDGVSDTGLTLRAFLPYAAAQSREDTYSYNGRTTVLDSRVTCQLPKLQGETVRRDDRDLPNLEGLVRAFPYLEGSVRATRATPRLGNETIGLGPGSNGSDSDVVYNASVPFHCIIPLQPGPASTRYNITDWQISLCQLGETRGGLVGDDNLSVSGGLISEFKGNQTLPGPNDPPDGTAYLMLNVTKGAGDTGWEGFGHTGTIYVPEPSHHGTHGEWLDLIYSNGAVVLSVTLCYSSFDTADLPVNISSNANRTESFPVFNFNTSRYTFDTLREQYGQYRDSMSTEQRGVLNMDKQDWAANQSEVPPVEPFMRTFANLGPPEFSGNSPNYSAPLWGLLPPDDDNFLSDSNKTHGQLGPDLMHIWLFQEIVKSGGSIAFALQSLITLLASMAYYDQLGQFDNKAQISQTSFVTANIPLRYGGFVAVTTVLFVHLVILGIIFRLFMNETRFSMLGNSWQSLSQGVTSETEAYLAAASTRVDHEVKKLMKDDGVKNVRVCIGQIGGSDRVGVMRVDDTVRRKTRKPAI